MPRFYQPDLSIDVDTPFLRNGKNKLVRRSYWLDMDDRTLVLVMDIKREHLIEQVCPQEILPPEK